MVDENALAYLAEKSFSAMLSLTIERAILFESNIKIAALLLIASERKEALGVRDIPSLKKAGEILVQNLGESIPNVSENLSADLNAGKNVRNMVVHELGNFVALSAMQVYHVVPTEKSKEFVENVINTIRKKYFNPMEKAYKISLKLLPITAKVVADNYHRN